MPNNPILTATNATTEATILGLTGRKTLDGIPLGIEGGEVKVKVGRSGPLQLSGTPSNYTIGTSDATVFTLAAGERGFIQNLDDAALAVKLGASASTTSLSFILSAGTAADDGKGGSVEIQNYIGVVSVAAMSGTARYIAWKQA